MDTLGQFFIDNAIQCWSCPLFDRMFQVISLAAAKAYEKLALLCAVFFLAIFAFYIFGAVWKNMTTGFQDGWFNKSLRPVFINSLFALVFLGTGVLLPRFLTRVTFEPVAYVTQAYSEAMIKMDKETIDKKVTYTPDEAVSLEDGIFRKELRDSIIDTTKVTITFFQAFIGLGAEMLEAAFSWDMIFGIGAFVKHFILAIVGLALFLGFLKLFFKFLCYFADVIIAMTMFAFFFPLTLVTATFKDVDSVPGWLSWIKNLGNGIGAEQIKSLIGAIVSLGAAIITYVVIMVIVVKFFTDPTTGENGFENLMQSVMNHDLFEIDLNKTGLNDLTLTSVIVLVYVLLFICDNIPKVTQMILGMFEVKQTKNDVGEKIGNNVMGATKSFIDGAKKTVNIIKNGGNSTSATTTAKA